MADTNGSVTGAATVVSPDGSTVFVAETITDKDAVLHQRTVAVSSATGATLWQRNFRDDGGGKQGQAMASTLAASPDGSAVYVTGDATNSVRYNISVTIAYSAATGNMLWMAAIPTGSWTTATGSRLARTAHGSSSPD